MHTCPSTKISHTGIGHVLVTMCMCAWACVCVCVRVCEHVYMDIKHMCVCVCMVCVCACASIRQIFYLYSYWCAVTLHLVYDCPSQVSNDTAYVQYSLLLFSAGQMRCLILHLQKKFLILHFIVTQIKYFCLLDLFI